MQSTAAPTKVAAIKLIFFITLSSLLEPSNLEVKIPSMIRYGAKLNPAALAKATIAAVSAPTTHP